MLENLTTATPAQIDTELARLQELDTAAENGFRAVTKKLEILDGGDLYRHYLVTETREELENVRTVLLETRTALAAKMAPLNVEYSRRRWARYYRVDNTNGHVHTTTACQYTYVTTSFGWLPQVSGFTAEQVVELAGAMTCLGCFPTVRAEILADRPCRLETKNQRATREEREARDAEKAAKLAAKAAKAITNPDGTDLRVTDSLGAIKTLRTAEMTYVDTAAELEMYARRVLSAELRRQHGQEVSERSAASDVKTRNEKEQDCLTLLTAIAYKLGTDIETERTRLAKKVEARYRRDWSQN